MSEDNGTIQIDDLGDESGGGLMRLLMILVLAALAAAIARKMAMAAADRKFEERLSALDS